MPSSHSILETEHASKYLQQMCKHFAHKVDAIYDAQKGNVAFPPGPCEMLAEDGLLIIICNSDSDEGVKVMQSIIDQHIVKFAWREKLEALNWIDGPFKP